MYTTLIASPDKSRAIMLRSFHSRSSERSRKPSRPSRRSESVYGTKSYNDALQRAFNRAKQQIYFNPDMKYFVTFTYKGADHTPEQVLHDIKMFIKRESRRDRAQRCQIKYIYVMEYQKRGSIHVHMIANDFFSVQVNKNGYKELVNWQKGFSSVLHIKDFDSNFRPYLYLFKYMRKAQRIGKSFIHASRNLSQSIDISDNIDFSHWDTVTQERTTTTLPDGRELVYIRSFLKKCDTLKSQITNQGTIQWLEQVKLHSTRESAKIAKSLSSA